MNKYVAFLRAINVGGHTVKMDHLQKLFESPGFSRVETFIASGNVIFETSAKNAAALEKKIAAHLEGSLGYAVDTFLRTAQEVAEIEERSPFRVEKEDDSIYVAFLHEAPDAAARSALMALKNKFNDFAALDREVYWLRLNRDDSLFRKNPLENTLRLSTTMRNLTTIHNLVEKYR
jgi:uncharacterized protein (DUF1697 family)